MPVSRRRKPKRKRVQLSREEICQRMLDAHFYNAKQDEESWNDNSLFAWSAYTVMQKNPNKDDFDTLLAISNNVALLMNSGYCEPDDAIYWAQEALIKIAARSETTGSFALDADAMKWLPKMLLLWDDLLKQLPRKVILQANRLQEMAMPKLHQDGMVVAELPPIRKRKIA